MGGDRALYIGWIIAWAVIVALVPGAEAAAADKELLDVLLANGAITQVQYEQLLGKEKLSQEDVREILVTVDENGLRARTSDGRFSVKLGGRLHVQASGHIGDGASQAIDGTEIRRARIDVESTLFEDFHWKGEVDFADNDVSLKDFWVGYTGLDWVGLFAGHQKQPFSLAVEMSSNDMPFIERGADTDLVLPFIDRAIGFRADFAGDRWHLASGFYGDSVDPEETSNAREGWGAASRLVFAPILEEDRVLHLGIRAAYRDPSNSQIVLRSETTRMSSLFPVGTGILTGVDDVVLVGPEMALAIGPFSLGGEYNQAFVRQRGAGRLDFLSWHVEATWSLTGESRAAVYRIDSGEFKRLRPARDFSLHDGGFGALELAVRYAAIDLDDGDVDGGREGVFTLAGNWYLNPAVRLMLEWSRILDTSAVSREYEGLNVIQSRIQLAF